MNGPAVLQNLRKLPSEIEATRDQYLSWAKDDASWTGNWSAFPEGIANMGDLRLSEGIDLKISIWSKRGEIDGLIASTPVCMAYPFVDFMLLRGTVAGDVAEVEVWDIISGRSQVFEKIQLVRNANILVVKPHNREGSLFPNNARLAMHPEYREDFMTNFCNRRPPRVP
jgi:hypothetical protein